MMNLNLIIFGGMFVVGFVLTWIVLEVLHQRKERRKNIHFHHTLQRIVSSDDPDEIIAIRDAYHSKLGQ